MVTLHYNYVHICNGMPDGMFYKSIIFIFTYPSQKESKESILSYLFLIIVIIYFVNHALNLPQGLPLLFYLIVRFSNMIHFSKDGHGWTNKQTCFFLSPPRCLVFIFTLCILTSGYSSPNCGRDLSDPFGHWGSGCVPDPQSDGSMGGSSLIRRSR